MNRLIDIKRVESNPTEPVTLAEAKAKLIVDLTDDDTLITSLITSCRKMVENSCSISIVTKTITMTADLFQEWELPYGPVSAVTSVKTRQGSSGSGPATYDTASGWQTDGEEFMTFAPGIFGSDITFNLRYSACYNNRYKIVYTAGYSTVPQDLKDAILAQIVHDYENRGDVDQSTVKDEPRGLCIEAEDKAKPYRRDLWF